MHRFMVFVGEDYYPSAGANDLAAVSDVLDLAERFAVNQFEKEDCPHFGWVIIYDAKNRVQAEVKKGHAVGKLAWSSLDKVWRRIEVLE